MKRTIFPLLIIGLIGLFAACNNSKKNTAATQDAQEVASSADTASVLNVDLSQSVVKWKGSKIVGGGHHGVVKVKSGEVKVDGETVLGGKIVVDMTSISSEDLEGDSKAQLEGHLKNADFFDVETYPEAVFEVTTLEQKNDTAYTVSGNLTIKDVTKNISVEASVVESDQNYTILVQPFTIDRTEWNVVYGSSKLTDLAKDAAIKDEIEFEVSLVVNK